MIYVYTSMCLNVKRSLALVIVRARQWGGGGDGTEASLDVKLVLLCVQAITTTKAAFML